MCVGYVKHHHGGIGPFKKPKYDSQEATNNLLAPAATSVYGDTKNEYSQEELRRKRKKNGSTFLTRARDRVAGTVSTILGSLFGSNEDKRDTLG